MSATATTRRGILFGASSSARLGVSELAKQNVEIIEVWDNDATKHGRPFIGLKIQAPHFSETTVYIASSYAKSIAVQLMGLGCRYRYIAPFVNFAEYREYFSTVDAQIVAELDLIFLDKASQQILEGLLKFRSTGDPAHLSVSDYPIYQHPEARIGEDAIIVDAGAWEGDTADFFKSLLGPLGKVICVEPNSEAAARIANDVRVRVVNSGLWNTDCRGRLDRTSLDRGGESGGFRVVPIPGESKSAILLQRLDSLELNRVDVIKMDIEGAEREAIEGASQVIRRDRPVLMICVYHRWDDLWKIPRIISSIAPYKFYLGQHTESAVETVLYAIPA